MDIGLSLREARERRGLTLQQVSQATKIPPTALDHLEHNRFNRLPATIFAKGYVRAFAASVGVDGERLIDEYIRQTTPPPVAAQSNQVTQSPGLGGGFLLVVLSVLAIAVAVYFRPDLPHPPLNDVTSATVASRSEPLPVATAGTTAASPPATPDDAFTWPVQLEIDVTGDCWVSATADGRRVLYRLVRRGENVSVTADNEVVLRVGDPTVLTYRLNGHAGRPVGRPGTPATVRINRETYRDLLQVSAKPAAHIGAS